jgi:hypothetical protein
MRKDIEHFADAVRDYGLNPAPLRDRGLAGADGLVKAVGLLDAQSPAALPHQPTADPSLPGAAGREAGRP